MAGASISGDPNRHQFWITAVATIGTAAVNVAVSYSGLDTLFATRAGSWDAGHIVLFSWGGS